MLMVQRPKGPEWKPVLGARFRFEPITPTMVKRARRLARESVGSLAAGEDDASVAEGLDALGAAFSHQLLIAGVSGWEDVVLMPDEGASDGGEALAFSVEHLTMLLADVPTFEALEAAYVIPYATREREKNASSPSPNGTGAGATPETNIASSRVRPKRESGAGRARTAKTSRRRTQARKSGAS